MTQSISITAFSTALFSTWVFVEPFGILFDCGDGITSSLLQKSRKIRHVFISHADRDHLAGLLQFNQLNGREGLAIHFPKDCGSFPALANFTARFDPHVTGTAWIPISDDDCIELRDDLSVRAFENAHVSGANGASKSLSFSIQSTRKKLKPEFAGLPGPEIARIRADRGSASILDEVRDTLLIYSGDTPVETDGRYNDTKVLIHESTFLTRDEIEPSESGRHQHSSLDALIEMVAESNIKHLIVGHFSSRYSVEQIDAALEHEIRRCNLKIPVQVIYPGQLLTTNFRDLS